MGIIIAMLLAAVVLMAFDPKFGAFAMLLALMSGLIQWKNQRDKAKKAQSEAKKPRKKKSTRPHKKH